MKHLSVAVKGIYRCVQSVYYLALSAVVIIIRL